MEAYTLRRLNETDRSELAFIAQVHEEIPAVWLANYTATLEGIEENFKRLVERHQIAPLDIFCCIAEKDGAIISFLWAEIDEKYSEILKIYSLWTDKVYRGQGIASKLKIELEKWGKEETKAEVIRTTVSAKNPNMIALNKKLGYEITTYEMSKRL